MPVPRNIGDEMRLAVDPATKKMVPVWIGGDIAFDDAMRETVMSLLFENEGPCSTARRRGPGPMSVPTDDADAPSQMKARAEERLQLAVDDGRLLSFTVTTLRPERGKLVLLVEYVTRSGRKDLVNLPMGH